MDDDGEVGLNTTWGTTIILPGFAMGTIGLIVAGFVYSHSDITLIFSMVAGFVCVGVAFGVVRKLLFLSARRQLSDAVTSKPTKGTSAPHVAAVPANPRAAPQVETVSAPHKKLDIVEIRRDELDLLSRNSNNPIHRLRYYRRVRSYFETGASLVLALATSGLSSWEFVLSLALSSKYLFHWRVWSRADKRTKYFILDHLVKGNWPDRLFGIHHLPRVTAFWCWWLMVSLFFNNQIIGTGVVVSYLAIRLAIRGYFKRPGEPPRLLTLRVFDSPSLRDYLEVISGWQFVGPAYRLEGPDTSGYRAGDLFRAAIGVAGDSILATHSALNVQLEQVSYSPDRNERFSVNTFQCGDVVWRSALEQLLDDSDVVVMYLGGFAQEHAGCIYELQLLINKFPLSRVILLTNQTSDMELLREVLDKAWGNVAPDSPNRESRDPLRFVNMGTASRPLTNEGDRMWKHYIDERINPEHIVNLLYETALKDRII